MIHSQSRDPIDNILSQLPACPDDSRPFFRDLLQRFPKVREGFQEFLAIPPEQRINAAAKKLQTTPRSGWQRFSLPADFRDVLSTHSGEYYGPRFLLFEASKGIESVLEHSAEAQELFLLVFENHSHICRQWGAEVLKFHDFVEAITGDFKPGDITKPEKIFLEEMALELLTAGRKTGNLLAKHIYNCMQIFEGQAQNFASLSSSMLDSIAQQHKSGQIGPHQQTFVNFLEKIYQGEGPDLEQLKTMTGDIDSLQMLLAGRRFIHKRSYSVDGPTLIKEWTEFVSYIKDKIKTDEAKLFCQVFQEYFHSDSPEHMVVAEAFTEYSHRLGEALAGRPA